MALKEPPPEYYTQHLSKQEIATLNHNALEWMQAIAKAKSRDSKLNKLDESYKSASELCWNLAKRKYPGKPDHCMGHAAILREFWSDAIKPIIDQLSQK